MINRDCKSVNTGYSCIPSCSLSCLQLLFQGFTTENVKLKALLLFLRRGLHMG